MSDATAVAGWTARARRAVRAVSGPLRASTVALERPVFLWGNGESGTFVLYDLIALTGAFAFPGTPGPRKKGLGVAMDRRPIEGIESWRGAGLRFERDGAWIFDRILDRADARTVRAATVRRRYQQLADDWRWNGTPRRRALDKFPYYVLMTEAIDAVFPDALHVFVLRDPRLVLSSIAARFKVPNYAPGWTGYASGFYADVILPGYESLQNEPYEVRHAWQIEQVIRAGFSAARRLRERCLIARHEDLLADPGAQLDRIRSFIGVPAMPDLPLQAIRRTAPIAISEIAHVDQTLVPGAFQDFAVACGYDRTNAGLIANHDASP